jgi:hypothetical protein
VNLPLINDLLAEVQRQDETYAACEPLGALGWVAVLSEEVGLAAHAVLHRKTLPAGTVRMHLLRVAAAALRAVAFFDVGGA